MADCFGQGDKLYRQQVRLPQVDNFLGKSLAIPIRGIPFILSAMIGKCYALLSTIYTNYTIFLMVKQIDFRKEKSGLGVLGISNSLSSETRIFSDFSDY